MGNAKRAVIVRSSAKAHEVTDGGQSTKRKHRRTIVLSLDALFSQA
jgi:hypothetical protein